MKKLVYTSILAALSVVLSLAHMSILPSAPYLLYDLGDVGILIAGFFVGPLAGVVVAGVVSVVFALLTGQGGPYGMIMHFIASGTFVLVASLAYRFYHTKKGAALALLLGSISLVAIMIPANLIVTPIYLGAPRSAVIALLLPAIIPFNLIKGALSSVIAFLVYKRVGWLLRKLRL